MEELPVFRAPKRRRENHRRTDSAEPTDSLSPTEEGEEGVNVKRPVPSRRRVHHSSRETAAQDAETLTSTLSNLDNEQVSVPVTGLSKRFVGAGGLVPKVIDDKQMFDYIDRAIHERSGSTLGPSHAVPKADQNDDRDEKSLTDTDSDHVPQRSTGDVNAFNKSQHLSEVSLDTVHQETNESSRQKPERRRKPRLGRDGKPFRPRPRKGPDPEDIARNTLVEKVLHEHGLGTYERVTTDTRSTRDSGRDEHADERIAAEFQQRFLDAQIEREGRVQKQGQATVAKKDTATNTASGPRLGGSRSARAKMAASLSSSGTGAVK